MPTLSPCYLTEEFPKQYWKCIRVISEELLFEAPMVTLLEVSQSLLLTAYFWFYSSWEFKDTGDYPLFSTFFNRQWTFLKDKSNKTNDIWATKTSIYQVCIRFWGEREQQFNRTKCFSFIIKYNTLFKQYWPLQILQACSQRLKNNFLCGIHITDTVPSTEGICRSISYQQQDSSFMLNLESFY